MEDYAWYDYFVLVYNATTNSYRFTLESYSVAGSYVFSYWYYTKHTGYSWYNSHDSQDSYGDSYIEVYEPSSTLIPSASFNQTQETTTVISTNTYQAFKIPFFVDSSTTCSSVNHYRVSSSSEFIQPPTPSISIDISQGDVTIYASDAPNTSHNITFYLFAKACASSYQYKLEGPLNIVSNPCSPNNLVITPSTFNTSQTVISGNTSAFFQLPPFTSSSQYCSVSYTVTQFLNSVSVPSNLTASEKNGTVFLIPSNQTIGQKLDNITIVAFSGATQVTSQYHTLVVTQRVCNQGDEFLNQGGLCQKCPTNHIPDGTLYGCKQVEVPVYNSMPLFESEISIESTTYNLDQELEKAGQESSQIKIFIELPKIVDLDKNFESISVRSQKLGQVKVSNESGSFVEQTEGNYLNLNIENDISQLTISIPSSSFESLKGDHEFEVTLEDSEGARSEYKFSLSFELSQVIEEEMCVKDQRKRVEPYFIRSEYNYIEGATFQEEMICCSKGQSLSNSDALNKAVKMAKDKGAYGFFYKQDNLGNIKVGFYQTKEHMQGNWIHHNQCYGGIGFLNDFDSEDFQKKSLEKIETKEKVDTYRDKISLRASEFQQNGKVRVKFSEELVTIDKILPNLKSVNGKNQTFGSLQELNKNIHDFIDIKYITNVPIDEDKTLESQKIPELESFQIVEQSSWHMDLKLKFKNPLYVSSSPDKDLIIIKILNPNLFKSLSDSHLIDTNFRLNSITVPPQAPSEEAFSAINKIGQSMQGSLLATFIIPFTFTLIMKASMNRVWALFYMLQLLANLANFKQLLTPANAMVMVDMIQNVVDFKIFDNEIVQSYLVEKVLTKKTMWIKRFLLDQGIDFTNSILFAVGFLVIVGGTKIAVVREFFENQKKAWMWGGIIRSKITCYLPTCIMVFTQIHTMQSISQSNEAQEDQIGKRFLQDTDNKDETPVESYRPFDFVKYYWKILVICLIPVLSYKLLKANKEQITDEKFRQKFGTLYVNLKTNQDITLSYSSIFCLRRLLIASFTVFFGNILIVNIYINIFSCLAFIKILFDKKPMEFSYLNHLEITNEIYTLLFNYSLILFTPLVPSVETRFNLGYFFIALTSIILCFNFAVISWSLYQSVMLQRRIQKAENAWREVEPLKDKMTKFLARRTMERVQKQFGIQNFDLEAQEKAIKSKYTYKEMQDKIVSLLDEKERVKKQTKSQNSQMNVFKLAQVSLAHKDVGQGKSSEAIEKTPRFGDEDKSNDIKIFKSIESFPSEYSVDEDFVSEQIQNLQSQMQDQRDDIEVEDNDWDEFDRKYQEVTQRFEAQIEEVKNKAQVARDFKIQRESQNPLDFTQIIEDKEINLISKSQVDKRFIKSQSKSKTSRTSRVEEQKEELEKKANNIKIENLKQPLTKSKQKLQQMLVKKNDEKQILQEVMTYNVQQSKDLVLKNLPQNQARKSVNQMNAFALKHLLLTDQVKKLSEKNKLAVIQHFNIQMRLDEQQCAQLKYQIWNQTQKGRNQRR